MFSNITKHIRKKKFIVALICTFSFLFASNVALVHEHKDDKVHDDCPICIFKISNNIESAGKPLPVIPKAPLPKPVYIKPFFKSFVISIKPYSRSPPLV
jgi:hypothetical protein